LVDFSARSSELNDSRCAFEKGSEYFEKVRKQAKTRYVKINYAALSLRVVSSMKGKAMTIFIKTSDGTLVSSSAIFEMNKVDKRKTLVMTEQGKIHMVNKRMADLRHRIELETAPSEKADPGYSIVFLLKEGQTMQSDVIAWTRVGTHTSPDLCFRVPVAAGWVTDFVFYALKIPSGALRDPVNGSFEDETQWLDFCNRRLRYMQQTEDVEDTEDADEISNDTDDHKNYATEA
jgi:hypothetical protein